MMVDEDIVLLNILNLKTYISVLKAEKSEDVKDFEDLLSLLLVLWSEYSVEAKRNEELEKKLVALSAFCGVR